MGRVEAFDETGELHLFLDRGLMVPAAHPFLSPLRTMCMNSGFIALIDKIKVVALLRR